MLGGLVTDTWTVAVYPPSWRFTRGDRMKTGGCVLCLAGQPPVSFFVTLYKCHPRKIQNFFFLMRCLLIFECWQPCQPQSHACWLASESEGRADECQRPPGDTRLPEGQLRRVEVTVQMVTYCDGHGDGLGTRGGRSRCQESASRRR